MARIYLMSWDQTAHRWFKATPKKYQDVANCKIPKISCKQLGAPSTKAASYRAANAWWQAQVAEWERLLIASKERAFPKAQEDVETLDQMVAWLKERNQIEDAEAKEELARRLRAAIERGEKPDYLMSDVFGITDWSQHKEDDEWLAAQQVDIEVWVDRLNGSRSTDAPDESLGAWADQYLNRIRPTTKPQSLENIVRQLNEFVTWRGRSSSCKTVDEQTVNQFYDALQGNGKAQSTNRDTFRMTFRRFVLFLAENRQIELPLNLHSRLFRFETTTTPEIVSKEEIIDLLTNVDGKLRLYVLLCLNCGMNNADIGKLRNTSMSWRAAERKLKANQIEFCHVDWSEGRIVRQRVKTSGKGAGVPTVCYLLWSETFELLKEFRSDHPEACLVTSTGEPLYERELKRKDEIYQAFKRNKSVVITPKQLRSSAASLFDEHESFGRFAFHFLANSPRGIPDRNYKVPSQTQFDKAVRWLGRQLGIK